MSSIERAEKRINLAANILPLLPLPSGQISFDSFKSKFQQLGLIGPVNTSAVDSDVKTNSVDSNVNTNDVDNKVNTTISGIPETRIP